MPKLATLTTGTRHPDVSLTDYALFQKRRPLGAGVSGDTRVTTGGDTRVTIAADTRVTA